MSKHYIVLDVDNLSHRNWHALSTGTQHNRIIYGLLRDIVNLSAILGSNDFLFCFDSETSIRSKLYPEYKMNRVRDESHKRIRTQIESLLTDVLPGLGFMNLYCLDGYEADDLIGLLCQDRETNQMTIVSNDQDFYQLLCEDQVFVWNPHEKKTIGYRDFITKYGIFPKDWIIVKSAMGCKSDNIKGVCGIKTALDYVRGTISTDHWRYKKIIENQELVNNNLKLVQLPCPLLKKPPLLIYRDSVTRKNWQTTMIELGFHGLSERSPFA